MRSSEPQTRVPVNSRTMSVQTQRERHVPNENVRMHPNSQLSLSVATIDLDAHLGSTLLREENINLQVQNEQHTALFIPTNCLSHPKFHE